MRRAGISLLEVVVSSALLLGIAIVVGSSSLTARRVVSSSQRGLDLDLQLRHVLDDLRRELRQSGWSRDGTSMLSLPALGPAVSATETPRQPAPAAPVDLLVYRIRQGPEDTDWGSPITIRAVPYAGGLLAGASPPLNLYQLERVQDGQTVRLLHRVTFARVERLADSPVIRIRIELSGRGEPAKGSSEPSVTTRIYEDKVRLLNRKSGS